MSLALATIDWPLNVSGGPGKAIIIWILIALGLVVAVGIIEWKKTAILIDKLTKNKWRLTDKINGMSDKETSKVKSWAWIGVIAWALIIASLWMFLPQFGARQIKFDNVISTYNITSITPSDKFDRRLLTDNGKAFKLTGRKQDSYPVKFLVENANVETNGAIVVNGNKARLIALDSGPSPTVKTGSAKSLF